MCKKIGLVAFDMDGVLITCRSSWRALHLYFGSEKLVDKEANEIKFRTGKINYVDWMRLDTQAIIKAAGRPVKRDEIIKVLLSLEIDPEAFKTISYIKKKGIETAIVSGGIDLLAFHLAKLFDIHYVYANKLLFDEKGNLIPGGIEVVNPLHKDLILKKLSLKTKIPLTRFMYVGDSEWDQNAFKAVKHPVLLMRAPELPNKLKNLFIIHRLGELIDIIDKTCSS